MAAKKRDSAATRRNTMTSRQPRSSEGDIAGSVVGDPVPPSGLSGEPQGRVAGIGASAGGLEALIEFFKAMRPDSGMAFVVVSHLDPEHKSALGEILARVTTMQVCEAQDGVAIAPDHVYIIPPNRDMVTNHGLLHLTPRPETRTPQMPIDTFLRSLAADFHNRAVGVILSGTASDGSLGLKAIKDEGGLTFAQDETAKYHGMPRSAVAAGGVDLVLPPAQIAAELFRISTDPLAFHPRESPRPAGAPEEETFLKILRLVADNSGVDFLHYKHTTLLRRVERRMVLLQLRSLTDYLNRLRDNDAERRVLAEEILIPVTSFFRDPEMFEVLKTNVFPRLFADRNQKTAIRVWVPGCASGEEAYSVAICLLEFLGAEAEDVPIKIFACDIGQRPLEAARAGAYAEGIAADVSAQRLARFFIRTDRGYEVRKTVRDLCVFARQDLTRDPPFSQLDLVCCRNVLIYLGHVLHDRVLHTLHYSLKPGGVLVLGNSETVGSFTELFEVLDKKHKIYSRTSALSRLSFDYSTGAPARAQAQSNDDRKPGRSLQEVYREADRMVLARYAPSGVLVNEYLQIVQFRGDTGRFLKPAPGPPTTDLLLMAREGLLGDLRNTLDCARRDNTPARKEAVRLKTNDHFHEIDIEVIPITDPATSVRHFVVLFETARHSAGAEARATSLEAPPAASDESARDQEIGRLASDLAATKHYLQSVIEEKEAANEELLATNEAIICFNEELQSTNEELTTAKEELQATNEELMTVNDELQNRIRIANQLADDLTRREREIQESRDYAMSIVETVRQPLLVLDGDLRVRTANRAFYQTFHVSPDATEGRLIYELGNGQWNIPRLQTLLQKLLPRNSYLEDFKVEHAFPDIGTRTMLLNARRMVHGDGGTEHLILLAIEDITSRLRDSSARKALEREVLTVTAIEQQRIGRDLHDTSGQELTALGLLTDSLIKALDGKSPAAASIAAKMAEGINRVLGQIRASSRGLIGVEVDSEGLMAALAELSSETSQTHGVSCTFDCKAPVHLANNQAATQLYCIVREAIINALKHAQARSIKVSLEGDAHSIRLRVQDNGMGFNESRLDTKGMGLKIMRYRAGLINALLSISAATPTGTIVTCTINKDDHDAAG
jgi:two-component system, chemotaxis family, CheB/CheR fusion protein